MGGGKNILFLFASVSLILVAIILTSLLNKQNSGQGDVRAKASQSNNLVVVAVVDSLDDATSELIVNGLAFETSQEKKLGDSWRVTGSGNKANIFSFSPGQKIKMKIDSNQFSINGKTLVATEISKR